MPSESGSPSSSQPLLPSHSNGRSNNPPETTSNAIKRTYVYCQSKIRLFLASKEQHFCVLALVSLDLLSIFGDILIQLYVCDFPNSSKKWTEVREFLEIAGLVFSSLFMVELGMSLWVFGFRYFNSKFHCLDATVILAGFIIDVILKGILEEIASLVVILRLWRFFKIIEEFSAGAQEQMEALEMRIEQLESENGDLKQELKASKGTLDDDRSR